MTCSDPTSTNGPEFAALFGECIFSMYTDADMDLTREMQAAAAAANFPARYALIDHDIKCHDSLNVPLKSGKIGAHFHPSSSNNGFLSKGGHR